MMTEHKPKPRSLASTSRSETGELALKPNQLQAIALLVQGRTIKDTGADVGAHPNTVSIWLRENETFQAEYEHQRREAYMRSVQLAHSTLAEVMENRAETGLTRTKAAQAALLHDGQRLRARASVDTACTVLDKLAKTLEGLDTEVVEAEYQELAAEAPQDEAI